METKLFFSAEEIDSCVCTEAEFDEAVVKGSEIKFASAEGTVTTYLYGGKYHIAAILVSS